MDTLPVVAQLTSSKTQEYRLIPKSGNNAREMERLVNVMMTYIKVLVLYTC